MYDDDVILMSSSVAGLKASTYYRHFVKVNIDKTKVFFF